MEHPTHGLELRDYLRLLKRRKWIVISSLVVVVAVTLGYSFWQTPRYTATAKVLIESNGVPPQLNSSATTVLQPSDIQTQVGVISSAPVQAAVTQKIGTAHSVDVNPEGQKDIIDVAATSTDRRQAAAIANAYVNAYVDFRRNQAVSGLVAAEQQIQAKISDLDRQIAALDAQVANAASSRQSAVAQSLAPQRSALSDQESAFKSQLAQLQVNSAVQTGAAQVLSPASIPTSPSSPQTLRNGLLAAAAGLLVGVALAFLLDYFDDSVKTKDGLERVSEGLPVLGLIPAVKSWRDKSRPRVVSLTDPTSQTAEAYRSLRTSIQFLGLDNPVRTLQITSPTAAEGKTTTIANLAVALAWSGQRVLVADCDLRRPRLHEFFGLSNEVGFTSMLLGRLPVPEACQAVRGQERLALLVSGPLPLNPSELFGSRRAAELLSELRSQVDILLLDSPPVLPVADATVLSAQADATLLVATAGRTTGKLVARAIEVLKQVGAPLAGTILNAVATDDGYGYTSGYRYYRAAIPSVAIDGSGIHSNGDVRERRT